MSVYLIDFENVHYDGLRGILNLTPDDQVYIFYSDNGKRLTFELHEQINNSPAQFYYYKAVVGSKNALDHQLSSYLGFLIGKTGEKDYYIVSKDRGYRHLVAFWESADMGLKLHLVDSIRISRLSDADKAKEDQPKDEKGTEGEAKEEKAIESSSAKISSSRRRGRVVKAKPQAETDTTAAATEEKALENDNHNGKPQTSKTKQRRAPMKHKLETTKEENEEQVYADETVKEPPKIVEFVLPDDIVSSKRYNTSSAKPEMTSTHNKTADQASSKGKTVKPKTNRNRKAENIKKVQAETGSQQHEDQIIKEDDILKLIPEAKDQPWLADIARYLNTSKGKAQLYNAIRRRLGQDEGRKIYNIIKKLV